MSSTTQESGKQSLGELIAHIEQTHHVFTRAALNRIKVLFDSLEANHTPESARIKHCFEELKADLLPHLMKEEHILFPYIVALEHNPGQPPVSCFGSVANPIRMMGMEHQAVQKLLERLRELTADYRPLPASPSDISQPEISAIYAALAELDRDLVEHIHLEGEVLFPQALELEKNTPT